ncbi:MAG TPA: hypothetical protein VHB74_10450 [Devosia sp.]|nr:hypothetical protein [Devosia sp.]
MIGLLVAFLPGVLLSLMLMPERVGPVQRGALVAGLALCWTALAGLGLDAAGRLDRQGWAMMAFYISGCGLAIWLLIEPRALAIFFSRLPLPRFRDLAALAVACVLAGSAVAVARSGAAAVVAPPYTELWGRLDNGKLVVDVKNLEGADTSYRLEILDGEVPPSTWSETVAAAPGAVVERQFNMSPPAGSGPIEARLYKTGSAAIYRHIIIWPARAE